MEDIDQANNINSNAQALNLTMGQSPSQSMNKTMFQTTWGNSTYQIGMMGQTFTEKNPLNLSKSKMMFSFSKAQRFNDSKSINPNVSYHIRGKYDNLRRESGSGRAFGSTDRFRYYPRNDQESGQVTPSPAKYEQKGFFSPKSQSKAFSFGLSKEQMKKVHLQIIEKQAAEKLPGPGNYEPISTFGKVGPKFSMSPKSALKDSALPGPGFYNQPDLVGKESSVKMTSNIKSPRSTKFPQAQDRFIVPTQHLPQCGPGSYNPKDRLNENHRSLYRSVARAVFGRDERRALEDRHQRNIDIPGPGMYELPSEFGRYEPPNIKQTMNQTRFGDTKRFSERSSPRNSNQL
eukprot:403372352